MHAFDFLKTQHDQLRLQSMFYYGTELVYTLILTGPESVCTIFVNQDWIDIYLPKFQNLDQFRPSRNNVRDQVPGSSAVELDKLDALVRFSVRPLDF